MSTPVRRRSIAPVLATAAVADAPHAPAGIAAGSQFAAVLNATLLELEYADEIAVPKAAPSTNVCAANGPLIVDGIVFPGLRFGS